MTVLLARRFAVLSVVAVSFAFLTLARAQS
jgi:hypothetical protein